MRLRLALRYDPSLPSGATEAIASLHTELLEHAVLADALGVEMLWIAERPFTAGAGLPAALPLLAAIAASTARARLGTAVLPLPLHHPLRVAEDAATLDAVSGGRLELGLGLGAHAEGFDGFGVATEDRASRFEEGVALLRAAWADAPLAFVGRHFEVTDVEVFPKPLQRGGPPIWIGAEVDTALRRAARLADGLLAGSAAGARRFAQACAAEGRDPGGLCVAIELPALAAGPTGALAAARGALAGLGRAYASADLVVPVFGRPEVPDAPALGLAPSALERLCNATWPALREALGDPD